MTIISTIFSHATSFIINIISSLGYFGIILLMAIESANIPLPSEIIMPFAGFLVFQGYFSLFLVALAGALGCTIGSIVSYYIGVYGGRPLVLKYGKYFLIGKKDLENADRWFSKYGDKTAFFSRLLPIVRTFISLPAGISRTKLGKFIVYTFIGSFIWSYLLAYIGYKFGQQWNTLSPYFHKFDVLLLILFVLLIVLFLYRKLKK